MSAVVHVDQVRGDGLGASEIAQAIGVAPPSWGAPIDLWQEKTGRCERRPATGQPAQWGQILEPVIRGVYLTRHRCDVAIPTESRYHAAKPWLRATPDGVVLADGKPSHLVQIKNVGPHTADDWGPRERREVPPYYLVQGAVEMAVTDLPRVDFAVLATGNEYFEVTLHRDEELEADILAAAAAFWRCVEEDREPPIDHSPSYGRYLGRMLAVKSKRVVEASPDLEAFIERWRAIRHHADILKKEEQYIKNRILLEAREGEARRVASAMHGIIPIVETTTTHRNWEALARMFGVKLGADPDAEIENYTTRQQIAYPRAPVAWSREDD